MYTNKNMNSIPKEYIIDKNYVFKNCFEEIKDFLEENKKINLVTLPKYVPIAFQLAKELNEEGIATYDEELKVERIIINKKFKTKIYLSIKRKNDTNEFIVENNYFYKNIFEQVKNHLKHHEKATILAKTGEVGTAFRIAKELVDQGIALYDEELKLSRNFKNGHGNTKVYISLKRKPIVKEFLIKKNSDVIQNFNEIKQLFKTNEKINLSALPLQVGAAFETAKKLLDEGIVLYDEELKIGRNFKADKNKNKIYMSLKRRTPQKSLNIINIPITQEKISEKSEKLGEIKINLDNKKIFEDTHEISKENILNEKLNNKKQIKEYKVGKKDANEILKDIKKLLKENNNITFVALKDQVGLAFTVSKILFKEGIASYDELKIDRNLKLGKGKTRALISINKKKQKTN